MVIKTEEERSGMMASAQSLKDIMASALDFIEVGMTTRDLDECIGMHIDFEGAESAPKVFYDWPSHACISVNEEVAHGVAGDRVIEEEDLVKVDISIQHENGYCTDMCRTVYFGSDPQRQHLVDAAKACFDAAVADLMPGDSVQKIGKIIDDTALDLEVFVEERLHGHGIGTQLHELPNVPNTFFIAQLLTSHRLRDGEVICIEPIVLHTRTQIYVNEHVYISGTGAHSAQYEDTVMITEKGIINLTELLFL